MLTPVVVAGNLVLLQNDTHGCYLMFACGGAPAARRWEALGDVKQKGTIEAQDPRLLERLQAYFKVARNM